MKMSRLPFHFCFSVFIFVLKISNSNCYNDTASLNHRDVYNISTSDSDIVLSAPFGFDNKANYTESSKHAGLEGVNDFGVTEIPVNEKATTTAKPPNLDIQSSTASVIRPTEATTPLPTTTVGYSETKSFKGDSDSDETKHEPVEEPVETENIKVQTGTSLNSKLQLDFNVGEIIENVGIQEEVTLKPNPKTPLQPKAIEKVEQNYINSTVVPVLQVPRPIVIDYDSMLSTNDSNRLEEKNLRTLQEKDKDGIIQAHESHSAEHGLISKESDANISLPEPRPTEASKTVTNNPPILISNSNESVKPPDSSTNVMMITPKPETLTPVPTQIPEPLIPTTTSTLAASSANNVDTVTETATEFSTVSFSNNPSTINDSSSSTATNEPSIILSKTPENNNATQISTANYTSSTSPTPPPTEVTSTLPPPPIVDWDLYFKGNNTIHQFFFELRTHTVLCLISLFLILLGVTTVFSILLACVLCLKSLWNGISSCFGMMKKCYVKRKDSSRNTYESGSLFPTRCDVTVRPYATHDHDMY